jgi:hypothetical protein
MRVPRRASFAAVLFLAIFAAPTFGARLPSFNLDECAWFASHIVVVTEGNKIDGVVEVLDSWKGDLKKGEIIKLPRLAEFAPEESRTIHRSRDPFKEDADRPAQVSGARMVLFLIKLEIKSQDGTVLNTAWRGAGQRWHENEMKVSVAWLERKKAYAITQLSNPGPSELIYVGTEEKFRERVTKIVNMQKALIDAVAQKDCAKMEDALNAIFRFNSWGFLSRSWMKEKAIIELAPAGKQALPLLRKLANQDSLWNCQTTVLETLANVGGQEIGPEITRMLEQELAFWRKEAPGLQRDWFDSSTPVGHRVHKTFALLAGLQVLSFPGCRKAVTELRDLWNSWPNLQMVAMAEECDKTLTKLPKAQR